MKKFTLIFMLVAGFFLNLAAQAPQKFHYQAVARMPDHQPYENANLRVRFFLLEDSMTGTVRYVEEHIVTTTTLGLFQTNVGEGSIIIGSMDDVQWALHPYFLRVEMNPQLIGGTFVAMGTSQLLSVPYALYAETSGGGGTQQLALTGNQLSISGGNSVTLSDNSSINELQTLALAGNVLSLSNGGGSVTLPAGGGGSYTAGNGITISGQTITASDPSPFNEIQTLLLSGNVLSLSNGGGSVTLPAGGNTFSLPYQGTGSDPNAVFDVKNTGSGMGILTTVTDPLYAGLVATNETNGNTAFLAGADYGAQIHGPLQVVGHYNGVNGAAVLDLHDDASSEIQVSYRPLNEEWKSVYASGYHSLYQNGALLYGMNSSTTNFYVPNIWVSPIDQVPSVKIEIANGVSAVKLFGDFFNHISLSAEGIYGRIALNDIPRIAIPIGGTSMESWNAFEMNLGSGVYPWNNTYAAAFVQSSDERLKEQIRPTQYGLDAVMKLNPVDYFWKNKAISDKLQTGFIAQEVEKIVPDAVSHHYITDEEMAQYKAAGKPTPEISDPYGVNYQTLTPILVKAVQEQQAMIELLRQQNELLQKRIEVLEQREK